MCKGLEEMPPGDSGEGVERSGRVSDGRKKVGGSVFGHCAVAGGHSKAVGGSSSQSPGDPSIGHISALLL